MNTSHNPFDFDTSAWPKLPQLPGVFVAGTDTDVGKTLIAGAIAQSILKTFRTVEVFKPVASGCKKTPAGLLSDDAAFLAASSDSSRALSEITPQCFAEALAPNVAADRAGVPVDLEGIFAAYSRMEGSADAFVVEGVGGLLCPLSDDFWVIHLARMTGMPMVIVAHPGLGTINHTLLTIHAARCAGIEVAGVIINRYQPDACHSDDSVISMQTNPQQIAEKGNVPILALVPDDKDSSVEKAKIGKDTQFAIDTVDWVKVLKLK